MLDATCCQENHQSLHLACKGSTGVLHLSNLLFIMRHNRHDHLGKFLSCYPLRWVMLVIGGWCPFVKIVLFIRLILVEIINWLMLLHKGSHSILRVLATSNFHKHAIQLVVDIHIFQNYTNSNSLLSKI